MYTMSSTIDCDVKISKYTKVCHTQKVYYNIDLTPPPACHTRTMPGRKTGSPASSSSSSGAASAAPASSATSAPSATPLPDERYAACAHAFLSSSDDDTQTALWVQGRAASLLDMRPASKVRQVCQVASFAGSSAFTDLAIALALCDMGAFERVVFVAEHTTAAYLAAVGAAVARAPRATALLTSGKLSFFAGDTDISRPTEDVAARLAGVYERRFDLLFFHRCLHRFASPCDAVSQCVQTLLASGGTAVIFHTLDDGMQQIHKGACGTDRNGDALLDASHRREYLDARRFISTLSPTAAADLNCLVCPLAERLSVSVNVREWADAADGWTKAGTDALTHVLGVS